MEAAGCEAWYPLEMLSVRGLVEVMSRLPQLVVLRRALFRRLVAERVPVFVGVDAPDFNLGLESEVEARRRAQPASRQPVGLGVAPRTAANDRPLGAPDARAVPVRAAALRSGRHSGHLRRPSARRGCGGAELAARSARAAEARRGPARVRAAAGQPRVRARHARRARAAGGRGAPRGAAGCAISRAARDQADARPLRSSPSTGSGSRSCR